jgi:hypothetical protein
MKGVSKVQAGDKAHHHEWHWCPTGLDLLNDASLFTYSLFNVSL